MRKLFVQNIFFLLSVNLIVKPIWIFAIDLKVQNTVGNVTYGHYAALMNFSMIFQILLDFGLQNYNARTIAQSPQQMQKMFPNIIIAKLLLSVLYLILVMIMGAVAGYRGTSMYLLLLIAMVQILNSFVLYLRSNIAGMQHFKVDSMFSVADKLLMIAIAATLLYTNIFNHQFKIEWFVLAQLLAYAITVIISFLYCLGLANFDWKHLELNRIFIICKHSLPYALLIFLMAVYIRSDTFLLERLLPKTSHETGIYAAAFRLLDVSNNVTGVLFAGILLPLFGRMLARQEDVNPIVRVGINLLLPVAFTALAAACFFGNGIMQLQHKEAGLYDAHVFSVLMITFPAYCASYVYATLLTANGSLKSLIIISAIGVIINLMLNFLLIPYIGALGAAIAAGFTHITIAVLNILTAVKKIKLKQDKKWLWQLISFLILVFTDVYLIRQLNCSLPVSFILIAALAIAGLFICRLFSFKMMQSFGNILKK